MEIISAANFENISSSKFRKCLKTYKTYQTTVLRHLFSDYSSFIHEQALNVINNLSCKIDDWIAAVYDNEWYPGVVAEVS